MRPCRQSAEVLSSHSSSLSSVLTAFLDVLASLRAAGALDHSHCRVRVPTTQSASLLRCRSQLERLLRDAGGCGAGILAAHRGGPAAGHRGVRCDLGCCRCCAVCGHAPGLSAGRGRWQAHPKVSAALLSSTLDRPSLCTADLIPCPHYSHLSVPRRANTVFAVLAFVLSAAWLGTIADEVTAAAHKATAVPHPYSKPTPCPP
jgi:hypothetical protein